MSSLRKDAATPKKSDKKEMGYGMRTGIPISKSKKAGVIPNLESFNPQN